ncbi:UDP-N-acetylmuramate dehydrogenase [Glutamicibacter sp. PS]|uniref:UDP-N-acetylmuramate dehydrogenase n=1 Tax=Glutamicibacter sp. PS TaxID=3075634 RepID=UPI00285272EC|nr:UDP-N-acetylmuramate dehydrogenase [Glutamicibacter sp. PS]
MLADLTTSAVGGPADRLVTAKSEEQLVRAVAEADAEGQQLLLIGGGSNLVIADAGYRGTAVRIATRGVKITAGRTGYQLVEVAAGEPWDDTVRATLQAGLSGLEALSGIPGLTGATPVQNVGAYGSEVSSVLRSIRAYDRHAGQVVELSNEQLSFGYRDSLIKQTSVAGSPRFVVLSVLFELPVDTLSAPIRYAELARQLDVAVGERAEAEAVRETVLRLRRSKGMVYDVNDPDSHSTGSFFTNPIVDRSVLESLPEGAPNYPVATEGQVKLSAAWLIDQAGYAKGYGLEGTEGFPLAQGRASLSSKHTLAVTNRGTASAGDLLAIARAVRAGVQERFGILLHNEPLLIGDSL